jgi:hypothetical protein
MRAFDIGRKLTLDKLHKIEVLANMKSNAQELQRRVVEAERLLQLTSELVDSNGSSDIENMRGRLNEAKVRAAML